MFVRAMACWFLTPDIKHSRIIDLTYGWKHKLIVIGYCYYLVFHSYLVTYSIFIWTDMAQCRLGVVHDHGQILHQHKFLNASRTVFRRSFTRISFHIKVLLWVLMFGYVYTCVYIYAICVCVYSTFICNWIDSSSAPRSSTSLLFQRQYLFFSW